MKIPYRLTDSVLMFLLMLLLILRVPFAQAAEANSAVAVKSTAQQAAIISTGQGPFFRLNLPVTLYPTAAHTDLSDVRIRNASGHTVPYAWLYNDVATPQISSDLVALYAVSVPTTGALSEQADVSLEFKQNTDGSLLRLHTKNGQPKAAQTDWIIDVSQIKGSLLQARFELDDTAEGLFPLAIDASDDLHHWYSISGDEQLSVLKRQGRHIEKLSIDLFNHRAKFLRLHWLDAAQAITIKSVTIDSMQQNDIPAPLQWSAAIKAAYCTEHYCDYVLPAKTPIDSLRINLTEPNTLAAITLLGQLPAQNTATARAYRHRHHPLYLLRHKRQPPVSPSAVHVALAQAVVYRLTQPNGEARSENLLLDSGIYTHLRLQTEASITLLGQIPPSIEVASAPRSLIFLGQGSAPFTLSWGMDTQQGDALTLATLVPGYQPNKAIMADLATVNIPLSAASAAIIPALNSTLNPTLNATLSGKNKMLAADKKLWLWGALVIGLLLLAGMVWSLFRSMENNNK